MNGTFFVQMKIFHAPKKVPFFLSEKLRELFHCAFKKININQQTDSALQLDLIKKIVEPLAERHADKKKTS